MICFCPKLPLKGIVLGLHDRVLVGGVTGMVSVRSFSKFHPRPAEPKPDPKTDLPLAKAEPISNGGASGI